MKKFYLTLLIAASVLILALFIMYIYASFKTKENYVNQKENYVFQFNKCLEYKLINAKKYEDEKRFPQAKECFSAGGCFVGCGSGCGLPELPPPIAPSLSLFKMFNFYLNPSNESDICPDVCTEGCLYPMK